ncbi:MAG: type transporter [Bacteriovoracaceae bacterium]|nr:type transporter [Bacteriovoracaceae bacterium]
MSAEWIGFRTLLKKECLRFYKVVGQTILSPLVNAGLYLLVFGVSFSSMLKMPGGFSYLEFLVPGLIALSSLNNALQNSSSSVMISKFHGDLQDLKIIPISSCAITAAYSLASVVRGLGVAVLVLLLGEAFSYFQSQSFIVIQHPLGCLVFLVMSCMVFGNLGIISGFTAKSFDQINSFTNFIILPLIYLGGVFFSLKILSPFWQRMDQFNPIVYIINGIRWGVLGVSDISVLYSFTVLSGFVLLTSGLAWYAVKYGSYQRF